VGPGTVLDAVVKRKIPSRVLNVTETGLADTYTDRYSFPQTGYVILAEQKVHLSIVHSLNSL
jgi:hypothetical protein